MTALPYPPPFQSITTLAEHLDVSEGTIDNWVKMGQFPKPKKLGGKRLWSWPAVCRFIDWPHKSIEEFERYTNDVDSYEKEIANYPYPRERVSRIYFVLVNEYIKIGFTDDLRQRITQLMRDTPYRIRMLHHIAGGRETERSYHLKFARLRVRGEWFRADQELLEHIEMLKGRSEK